MTEFNTRVSKGEYEIIFKTDKGSDYTEIQEAIRKNILRNKPQILSRNVTRIETEKSLLFHTSLTSKINSNGIPETCKHVLYGDDENCEGDCNECWRKGMPEDVVD